MTTIIEAVKMITISIEYELDPENPADMDCQWKPISFMSGFTNYEPIEKYRTAYGKRPAWLQKKLEAGTAFTLDYYEHGIGMWFLSDWCKGDQWDTSRGAGLLLWNHPPGEMGAKTPEDRRKDAEAFLESYNDWCNGWVYWVKIEDARRDLVEHFSSYSGDSREEDMLRDVAPYVAQLLKDNPDLEIEVDDSLGVGFNRKQLMDEIAKYNAKEQHGPQTD